MTKLQTENAIQRRIEKLEKQSEELKKELEGELLSAKNKAKDIGKLALGIGGGFLAVFLSYMIFTKNEGQKDEPEPRHQTRRVYHRFRDQLVGELSNQALLLILGVAKDKMGQHLKKDANREKDAAEVSE